MLDPLSTISFPTDSRPVLPTRKLLVPSPDHPDDYTLSIDNSTLEKFNTCHRMMENYAIHSREADRDQSAQQFGRLFHLCEELRLRHGLTDAVKTRQLELISSHFQRFPVSPDDHRTADRMVQVLKVYNERYANDGWPERVVKKTIDEHVGDISLVEIPFKIELCTISVNGMLPYPKDLLVADAQPIDTGVHPIVRNLHVLWTGRIDAILRDSNLLWIVDHKTTSSGGREFAEAFKLAAQTVGYTWAAQRILDQPIAGCIINEVLIRAPLKTARGSAPREEFNRLTYFYSQDRLDEWYDSVTATISDFVACLVRGYFPMTGPKSFKSPCTYCDYSENCQLPRHQRATDLATSLYRNVTWNPIHADA